MPTEAFTEEEQAARLAEVERLAQEFSRRPIVRRFDYRSVSADIELLMNDVARDWPENPLQIALIVPIQECVINCYYERGALEPLVKARAGVPYRNVSSFNRLLDHLEKARRFDLIERLWTAVARKSRAEFFYHLPARQYGVHERVDEHKKYALEAYGHAIAWLMRIGSSDAAQTMTKECDALREERFPTLPPASDSRRMDDDVFWQLIVRAQADAASPVEQLAMLGEMVRDFKAADIKRFGAIYARLMKQLYHWNVWALAYAARGGCSDGAFEEFRTWLIVQGDPALVDLAIADVAAAAKQVPRDPELPDGTLLPIIDEAYLARAGSTLALPAIDLAKPKGKEWREDAFDAAFPELVRHYAA